MAQSRGAETGIRSNFIKGLNNTLAIWWLESNQELVFIGDAGTTEVNGKSRRYGVNRPITINRMIGWRGMPTLRWPLLVMLRLRRAKPTAISQTQWAGHHSGRYRSCPLRFIRHGRFASFWGRAINNKNTNWNSISSIFSIRNLMIFPTHMNMSIPPELHHKPVLWNTRSSREWYGRLLLLTFKVALPSFKIGLLLSIMLSRYA